MINHGMKERLATIADVEAIKPALDDTETDEFLMIAVGGAGHYILVTDGEIEGSEGGGLFVGRGATRRLGMYRGEDGGKEKKPWDE